VKAIFRQLSFAAVSLIDTISFLFDPISDFVETPDLQLDPVYKRNPFQLKLNEMGASDEITAHILNQLPEDFTYNELLEKIGNFAQNRNFRKRTKTEPSR
jgi:hypothetical protein